MFVHLSLWVRILAFKVQTISAIPLRVPSWDLALLSLKYMPIITKSTWQNIV